MKLVLVMRDWNFKRGREERQVTEGSGREGGREEGREGGRAHSHS